MLELRVLTGGRRGRVYRLDRFPAVVGRGSGCEVEITDAGVWDRHAEIELERGVGYRVKAIGAALIRIDGEGVREGRLRHGSVLECGGASVRTTLSAVESRSGWGHRALFWGMFIGTLGLEGVVIVWFGGI